MSQKLSERGFQDVSRLIGCEENLLRAVINVEAPMGGFDKEGRLIILPEQHQIYRYMTGHHRRSAVSRGLARKRWNRKKQYRGFGNYRKNSKLAGDRRWNFIHRVSEFDQYAAYMGTSWGLPQIMGFNHKRVGYNTVFEMVADFEQSEDNQLQAAGKFIMQNRKLHDAFVHKDFQVIAAHFNGTGQVGYYSGLIKSEYHRLNGDDNQAGMPKFIDGKRFAALRLGSTGSRVRSLQKKLSNLGYQCDIDGVFGERTQDQVILFQMHNGLDQDGIAGDKTFEAFETAEPLELNKKPTPQILADSPNANTSLATTATGVGAAVTGAVNAIQNEPSANTQQTLDMSLEAAEKAGRMVEILPRLFSFAQDHGLLLLGLLVVCFGSYQIFKTVQNQRNRRWT